MARKHSTLHDIINELVDRTNTDTQRIRVLEQGGRSSASRMESLEKEILDLSRSVQKLESDLESGFKKRDAEISELKNTVKEMLKHLKQLASVSKVNELEAMLDIYNPLKSNFVTREDVERLIAERLSKTPKNNK